MMITLLVVLLIILAVIGLFKLLFSFAGILVFLGLMWWLIFLGGAVKIIQLVAYFCAKVFNTLYDFVRGK